VTQAQWSQGENETQRCHFGRPPDYFGGIMLGSFRSRKRGCFLSAQENKSGSHLWIRVEKSRKASREEDFGLGAVPFCASTASTTSTTTPENIGSKNTA
jgi:hypothetical protein